MAVGNFAGESGHRFRLQRQDDDGPLHRNGRGSHFGRSAERDCGNGPARLDSLPATPGAVLSRNDRGNVEACRGLKRTDEKRRGTVLS